MPNPLNADEVSKNTTPNALREASVETLEHVYNCAMSCLRDEDEKTVRQMTESINAIRREFDRRDRIAVERREKIMLGLTIVATIVGVVSAVFTFWGE